MTTIAVDERAADIIRELQQRAQARHLPFDDFLRELARMERIITGSTQPNKQERFRDLLPELESGKEVAAAHLPADFSREDIYVDHD